MPGKARAVEQEKKTVELRSTDSLVFSVRVPGRHRSQLVRSKSFLRRSS